MIAAAQHDLDKILEGLNPQIIEEGKKIVVTGADLKQVVEYYITFLDEEIKNKGVMPIFPFILSPAQIRAFFQAALIFEDHPKNYHLGTFTSKMMEQSYSIGHTQFTLDQVFVVPTPICENLHGRKEQPIEITLEGRWGKNSVGSDSRYCHFRFTEDYREQFYYLGSRSRYCHFIFEGDAHVSTYYSDMLLLGNRFCEYKTTQRETLQKLCNNIKTGLGHKIYFIHPDGSEELKRRD